MTRREAVSIAALLPLASAQAAHRPRLCVEGYIFQQYAQRQKKPLADVIPEVISMVREAGFRNLEFSYDFLNPEIRKRTLALVRENGIELPSVYNGGPLHDAALAAKTIERSLEVARICQPFGCVALVCNAEPKSWDADHPVEKSDAELAAQCEQMNALGRTLREDGFELRVHNHTPEMFHRAREWRYTLAHTDPKYVSLCIDLDWVFYSGQDPLAILREAGARVREVHVRNERNHVWTEDITDGDIDYRPIGAYLRGMKIAPLVVVELAYHQGTVVTRPLEKDLEISRVFAEKVFGVRA